MNIFKHNLLITIIAFTSAASILCAPRTRNVEMEEPSLCIMPYEQVDAQGQAAAQQIYNDAYMGSLILSEETRAARMPSAFTGDPQPKVRNVGPETASVFVSYDTVVGFILSRTHNIHGTNVQNIRTFCISEKQHEAAAIRLFEEETRSKNIMHITVSPEDETRPAFQQRGFTNIDDDTMGKNLNPSTFSRMIDCMNPFKCCNQ